MEKVCANKLSNNKEVDMILYFLFGVSVINPDQSGCWRDEKGSSLTLSLESPFLLEQGPAHLTSTEDSYFLQDYRSYLIPLLSFHSILLFKKTHFYAGYRRP